MIILAATPIGNLGDASARLRDALEKATVVASEDTRVTQRLLAGLGIANRPRLIALHEHNERQKAAELVELARETDLLVLSDAGMPTVSDPGFPLVAAAAAGGVEVTVIPGPSAVVTALAVSGLPTDRFAFEGFLPRKAGERSRRLAELAADRRTLVFFEGPSRLAASLTALAEAFGPDRPAAVCRELTKLHEEVVRGNLDELSRRFRGDVKGEIVLVIGPAASAEHDKDVGFAVDALRHLVQSGARPRAAASVVAALTGTRANDLYKALTGREARK